MKLRDQEHMACLSWGPPYSLKEVEQVLRAQLGNKGRDIGDLDV